MVMMWNKFSDGIVVDTSKFRMLCRYFNIIYGRKIGSVYGNDWCIWYWYMIGENRAWREKPHVRRVSKLEACASPSAMKILCGCICRFM